MKIKSMKVKNFKTFGTEGITLSLKDLTALVGENNTGKSNILEALDLFFNYSKTKMSRNCFHHDDVTKEIEIQITFHQLSDEEKSKFNIHLDENREKLTISQVIKTGLDEDSSAEGVDDDELSFTESKHGTKWIAEEEWLVLSEKAPTKKNIGEWWKNDLKIGDIDFKSLFENPEAPPSPEEYQNQLKQLWTNNFDIISKKKETGDEKVLGWKNKLKGNLPKFFYVEAVKKIEDDCKVLKTNQFGEMIAWLTRNISEGVKKDFQDKAKALVAEAFSSIDKDEEGNSKIAFLNETLNQNLGVNLNCKLELKFDEPNINDIVFPSPRLFADDGYFSEVSIKGHGFQRLAILALLRTYNDLNKKLNRDDERNVIIAIEEPEIYLHPPVKRSTYKLLKSISRERDQIIYSTHDSYFVSVENFDEIRILRKDQTERPLTNVFEFSFPQLIDFYKKKYGKDVTEISLRHRFGHICDESKNEGFFSKKIIIIEGDTEKYALPIYFEHLGFDIDDERISMISAGSVDNISYLYVIFNEFHIPCYIIFDGDRPAVNFEGLTDDQKTDAKKKSERNKELLQFLNVNIDEYKGNKLCFPDTTICDSFSLWEKDFENDIQRSVDIYDQIKGDAKALYATDSKPLTGKYFAIELTGKYPDKISPKINQLIENIRRSEWRASCLIQDNKYMSDR